jgi:hypothetical protein
VLVGRCGWDYLPSWASEMQYFGTILAQGFYNHHVTTLRLHPTQRRHRLTQPDTAPVCYKEACIRTAITRNAAQVMILNPMCYCQNTHDANRTRWQCDRLHTRPNTTRLDAFALQIRIMIMYIVSRSLSFPSPSTADLRRRNINPLALKSLNKLPTHHTIQLLRIIHPPHPRLLVLCLALVLVLGKGWRCIRVLCIFCLDVMCYGLLLGCR